MEKILVVDDSETLRSQVRQALEGSGYGVVEGVDGFDGIQRLKENSDVRLILCDVNMPKMDGLTMCQKISEDPKNKGLPILMLTTEASPELKQRGKSVGVIAWITKPFSPDRLPGVVNKVLSSLPK